MIRDFPIFGVGIGCWPEIFPHYQSPPWMSFYFRRPENDYIQLMAETGLAGMALALWFGAVVWRKNRAAASHISVRQWPLFAAIAGGPRRRAGSRVFRFQPAHACQRGCSSSYCWRHCCELGLTHGEDRAGEGIAHGLDARADTPTSVRR